jgi:hypothetical protein
MRRLLFAGAVVSATVTSLAGCYWLAVYPDLTSDPDASGDASSGLDASPPLEAEAGPYCPVDAGPLVYCMDFDGVDASAIALTSEGAAASIVSGTYTSRPNSLLVDLYARPGLGGYNVPFPTIRPRTATLQFDVNAHTVGPNWITLLYIALIDDANVVRTANVVVSPDDASPDYRFRMGEHFAFPDGGEDEQFHSPGGAADAGAWHHVVLSLTVDDANQDYHTRLTVDGQGDQELLAPKKWAQGKAQIAVGVTCCGGAGRFYFDNVRAEFGL